LERSFTLCCFLLIDLIDHCLYLFITHVAAQFGLYTSGMHGRSTHSPPPVALVPILIRSTC
jgi:hypothetical protein